MPIHLSFSCTCSINPQLISWVVYRPSTYQAMLQLIFLYAFFSLLFLVLGLRLLFIHEYRAPRYIAYCCVPVSEVFSHQHLRSASRRKLNILRFHRSTFGTWAFSVASPQFGTHCIHCMIQQSSLNILGRTLKLIILPDIETWNHGIALYKSTFTYYVTVFFITFKTVIVYILCLCFAVCCHYY